MPCLHSFCGACYTGWMKRSKECPYCREPVTLVKKNAQLNSMIAQYLTLHPEADRSKEEKEALEAVNEITMDVVSFDHSIAKNIRIKGREKGGREKRRSSTFCAPS